jgi:hypothetical protein
MPLQLTLLHVASCAGSFVATRFANEIAHAVWLPGHVQAMTTLLEAGAAVDARDDNKFTPLHYGLLVV